MALLQRIGNRESGIGNRESGIGNRESGIRNRESGIGNRESGIGNQENILYTSLISEALSEKQVIDIIKSRERIKLKNY
ncbi:MAG: hypothetical protein F6K65_03700 [Moorea sp. SIO3C2]|nr:hypothetical protein [Moorena sp. SIO3C2]